MYLLHHVVWGVFFRTGADFVLRPSGRIHSLSNTPLKTDLNAGVVLVPEKSVIFKLFSQGRDIVFIVNYIFHLHWSFCIHAYSWFSLKVIFKPHICVRPVFSSVERFVSKIEHGFFHNA